MQDRRVAVLVASMMTYAPYPRPLALKQTLPNERLRTIRFGLQKMFPISLARRAPAARSCAMVPKPPQTMTMAAPAPAQPWRPLFKSGQVRQDLPTSIGFTPRPIPEVSLTALPRLARMENSVMRTIIDVQRSQR